MYYSVWLYQWPRVFFWPTMISQIQMQGDHLTTVFSPFSNLALSVRNWGEICLQSLSVSHLHQSWQLLKITLHCSKIIAKLMLVNGQSISNITSFLLKKFQNILCKYIPGPFAPPDLSRPSLKTTALSYSWTTWNRTEERVETRESNVFPQFSPENPSEKKDAGMHVELCSLECRPVRMRGRGGQWGSGLSRTSFCPSAKGGKRTKKSG